MAAFFVSGNTSVSVALAPFPRTTHLPAEGLAGGAVKQFGHSNSDAQQLGHPLAQPADRTGKQAAHRVKSGTLWSLRLWQAVLISVSLLAASSLRAESNQEPGAAPVPAIEFTVQTGHLAEIQGLEYATNG